LNVESLRLPEFLELALGVADWLLNIVAIDASREGGRSEERNESKKLQLHDGGVKSWVKSADPSFFCLAILEDMS